MPLGPAKVCPRTGASLVTGSACLGPERGRAASSVALLCEPECLTLMSVLTGRCTRSAVRICHTDMLLLCSPCGVNNRSCRKLKAPTSTSATNISHIWRDQNDPPRYRFSVWWMETSAGQSIPNLSPHCPDLRYIEAPRWHFLRRDTLITPNINSKDWCVCVSIVAGVARGPVRKVRMFLSIYRHLSVDELCSL